VAEQIAERLLRLLQTVASARVHVPTGAGLSVTLNAESHREVAVDPDQHALLAASLYPVK